jgi:hypothetical protein
MPEKREFPRLVSMHDPVLDAVRARAAEAGQNISDVLSQTRVVVGLL